MLIGRIETGVYHVERALPGKNLAAAHDLYELDPEDFVRADAEAERAGLELLGFYHSHPRGPERLSQVDRDRAWPGYVQVLIASGFSAWWQASERAEFTRVTLAPEDFFEKAKPHRPGSISVCERDEREP